MKFSNYIRIHKEGYVFIIIFTVIALLLLSFSGILGVIAIFFTGFSLFFFRDPERLTPIEENLVISPADGIVQSITESTPPDELTNIDEKMLKISIFLNLFDVHVNRAPVTGKVIALHYYSGKFFNASLDKASKENERQSVLVETAKGHKVIFAQIAGLIGRRIICDLEEGGEVVAGQRYGIIRFGSRLDVYLPRQIIPLIGVGQRCVGGETVLANFDSTRVTAPLFEIK